MASRSLRRRPSRGATAFRIRALLVGSLASLMAPTLASPARAELPPENSCPTLSGLPGGGPAQDAAPVRIREGMQLSYNDVLLLGTLLPVEVWRNRNAFFHEGMRMEIGPCHRRYPLPGFYAGATELHAGKARLDTDGNLTGHVAGLPFPPETIDTEAGDAGVRWAWNVERRYRGAGPSGRFRIVDMPSRMGGIQTYEGRWDFVKCGRERDNDANKNQNHDTRDIVAMQPAATTGCRRRSISCPVCRFLPFAAINGSIAWLPVNRPIVRLTLAA